MRDLVLPVLYSALFVWVMLVLHVFGLMLGTAL